MILNLLRHYPKIQAIKPRLSPKLQRCVKLSRLQAAAPATGDGSSADLDWWHSNSKSIRNHESGFAYRRRIICPVYIPLKGPRLESQAGGKQHDTLDLITLHLINSFELPLAFHLVKSSQNVLFWRELKRTNQSTVVRRGKVNEFIPFQIGWKKFVRWNRL